MRAASCATNRRGSARGRQADDVGAGPPHGVGHHQVRAGRADVDRHAGPLARVDVEQRRLASTGRLSGRAFNDAAFVEEFLHQQSDGAAAHFHAAGQVGARDGLVAADQREGDLAIDVPRGAARRHVEAGRVNAAHLHYVGANPRFQRTGTSETGGPRRRWVDIVLSRDKPYARGGEHVKSCSSSQRRRGPASAAANVLAHSHRCVPRATFGLRFQQAEHDAPNQDDSGREARPVPSELRSRAGIRRHDASFGSEDRIPGR